MTIKLESLQSNKGSRRKKMRKGRGIAAGQGASCGFGMRGQKSRSGRPTRPGFEGGQMPLYRRLPKRGFKSINSKKTAILNLSKIQNIFEKNRIELKSPLDLKSLNEKKLINKKYSELKILGSGEVKDKVNIEADLASKSAIEKLEKIGGSIQLKNK